ncbi:MAG: hypothetical protein ACLFUJ_14390 [Phycisphaerae bacterium]
MKPETRTVHGQESFLLANRNVELAVTRTAGHMAPVRFAADTKSPIEPYYISPWQDEQLGHVDPPVLTTLRGDFFCMPFGGENRYRQEDHTTHGEPATGLWTGREVRTVGDVTTLTMDMKTKQRPGRITKRISIVEGQNVLYLQHELTGYRGKMCLGHHATLDVPQQPGSMRISTSPFGLGMTRPGQLTNPGDGEYQSFALGQQFKSLKKVPLLWKDPPTADLTALPAREGFTDLLAVYKTPGPNPAWMTAVVASRGYLWFSLKDPDILPATVFWISNKGRHAAPWSGRNRCLGLEDVCAYFADGLTNSAKKNIINEHGFDTTLTLSPKSPTHINYIQGVVKVPKSFQAVRTVTFRAGTLTFRDHAGNEVKTTVNYEFLKTGTLD